MAFTLGGVTLPMPEHGYPGIDGGQNDVAARHEMADGSVEMDYFASRRTWKFSWKGLLDADKVTVCGAFMLCVTRALVLPDGSTATVWCTPGSLRTSYITDAAGNRRWKVAFAVEETG